MHKPMQHMKLMPRHCNLSRSGYTNVATPIDMTTAIVKYSNRQKYLRHHQPHETTPPVYMYIPPTQYDLLKQLVLHKYTALHFTSPRFIALHHPTLHIKLVRSHITLTDDQLVDVSLAFDSN